MTIGTTDVITQCVGRLVADVVARSFPGDSGTQRTVYEWRLAIEKPFLDPESRSWTTKTVYITCKSTDSKHAKLTKGSDVWVLGKLHWSERPQEYAPTSGPKAGAGPGFYEPDLRVMQLYVLQWRNTGHRNQYNVRQKTDPKIPF